MSRYSRGSNQSGRRAKYTRYFPTYKKAKASATAQLRSNARPRVKKGKVLTAKIKHLENNLYSVRLVYEKPAFRVEK